MSICSKRGNDYIALSRVMINKIGVAENGLFIRKARKVAHFFSAIALGFFYCQWPSASSRFRQIKGSFTDSQRMIINVTYVWGMVRYVRSGVWDHFYTQLFRQSGRFFSSLEVLIIIFFTFCSRTVERRTARP